MLIAGKEQTLEFEHVQWVDDDYKTAHYHCVHCNAAWTNADRWDSLIKGYWKAKAPFTDTAGFHISSLYSPWVSIEDIVKGYLEAKRGGQEQLKAWKNTTLGLPFEENLQQTPVNSLVQRKEDFSLDRIPDEVVYITVGGDTQDDREELTFLGWRTQSGMLCIRA